MEDIIESIKEPILELRKIGIEELKNVKVKIGYIIKNNIKDENIIEHTLDELLNLTYIFGSDIEDVYYNLVDYYKTIDLESSNDYKKYYLSIIKDF